MLILKEKNKLVDYHIRFKRKWFIFLESSSLKAGNVHGLIMDVIMCSKDVKCNNKVKT